MRLVAAWLACWVPLVLVDGRVLHACPMHDGMPDAAMTAMMHASGSSTSRALAAMAQTAGRAHGMPRSGHPAAAHLCMCLGACSAAVAVLPGGPASVTVAVVERAAVMFTGRPEHDYVAAWVDFVLPFSTAPPSQG